MPTIALAAAAALSASVVTTSSCGSGRETSTRSTRVPSSRGSADQSSGVTCTAFWPRVTPVGSLVSDSTILAPIRARPVIR
jgi:hypothetical protein